ncbi:extracellular solute-binding protein [Bradyrhizobium sp. CCBAU 11445]|uniref:extracellular solute-binding protein n=1 Tax=Bradyrhizobium sp. CCBAU 11445 TaxID=1630896 RepID=UPI002304FBB5|nr:extracellular solute-binding protein [Bradyrhizobium sp. CCBAU 11445]
MITRRNLLSAAAVGLPALSLLGTRRARAEVREIRILEDGGISSKAWEAGYVEPFTKKTGIKVKQLSPNSLGKLRAMVDAGQTDVVLSTGMGSVTMLQAQRLGLIEPIDWAAVDPAPIYPEAKTEYGLGHQYFSAVMAWRAGMKEPKSWADFFDAKAFPGKRVLIDSPAYALTFAVLATGVPVNKLYPLDVDAGFRKIREFKNNISVWAASVPQGPQLLRDNEVQYGICYASRVVGDSALGMTWAGGRLDVGYACIVKNSSPEDRAAAYKLMHEMTLPENEAKYATIHTILGGAVDIERYLPNDQLSKFANSKQNKEVQWLENSQWWADNGEAVNKEWQQFKLSR